MGLLGGAVVLLIGSAAHALPASEKDNGNCTQLAAPANASMVLWPSSALSTRRVDAYEFGTEWSSVPGAENYTICYTQNTQSRLGGQTHTYEYCVTQKDTKLNRAYIFYANNGLLTAKVRANGDKLCKDSPWTKMKQVDKAPGISMVCTDEKVNGQLYDVGPFDGTGTPPSDQLLITNIKRQVADAKGNARLDASLSWKLLLDYTNSTSVPIPTSDLILEICAGLSQDYAEVDQAARTNFVCQYVPANSNGQGSTNIDLTVDDPARAVYVIGRVRPVGLCQESSVDTNNLVTVAKYYSIQVVDPIASGANGVDDFQTTGPNTNPFYIVTTSRTTPDQIVDVSYFTTVMAGMLDTWKLPVRTTPEGVIVHDTFITNIDGVVIVTSSNAGSGSSVALSLFKGDTVETATGLVFDRYLSEEAPNENMQFVFKQKGSLTTLESKSLKGQCVTENVSEDEYQPPFIMTACKASEKTQQFKFEDTTPDWTTPGATWTYTYDTENPEFSEWAISA